MVIKRKRGRQSQRRRKDTAEIAIKTAITDRKQNLGRNNYVNV